MMTALALDLDGKWVDTESDCSKAHIFITDKQISDSEISCEIQQQEMSSNTMKTIRGINCQAEGNRLDDFSFQFTVNDDGVISYQNSGENIWTSVKHCPVDKEN